MRNSAWLGLVAAVAAQAATVSLDDAGKLFDSRQWADAAAAYESIVAAEPGNAFALVRVARSRAANGQADEALAALGKWFATGSGSYAAAMSLPEFETLRADPRFKALVDAHKPCNTPEFRQFDFWVGDWKVESAAAPGSASRNLISVINGGCALREEYTTPFGYAGTSVNFYEAARKLWHQTWIDNQGGALYLEGGLVGNEMVLKTVTDASNVQRITWTPLADGRVRQHWESTSDGGKAWTTVFDGYYTRRDGG